VNRGASIPTLPANANITQTLFVLRGANMAIATDQAFTKAGTFTNYVPTNVVAVTKTGSFGVACAGGIYTAASKAGDAVVAAAQVWSGLTAAGLAVVASAANIIQKQESATPILSLTTGNTGALTADLFIQGIVTD